MANDELKDEQEPPNSTSALQPRSHDLGIPVSGTDPANSTGLFNATGANNMPNPRTTTPLSLFSFGGVQDTPQLYTVGVPSTGFESMNDISLFQTPQNQAIHNPLAADNVINPASYVSSQRTEQEGNTNSGNLGMPQPPGSFVNLGQAPLLHSTLDGEELGMNNHLLSSVVQYHPPWKLDGSFLNLGIESPMEALSRCSASGRNISSDNNQMAAFLRSNTSNTQSARNSLNSSINMAGGFSGFQNNGDGFSLVQQQLLSNSNSVAQTLQHEERPHHFMADNRVALQIIGSPGTVSGNCHEDCSTRLPIQGSGQVVVPNSRQCGATSLLPSTPGLSNRNSTQPPSSNNQRGVSPGLLSNSHFVPLSLDYEESHLFSTPGNRITPQIVGSEDAEFASSVSNNDFQDYSTMSLLQESSQVGVHDSQWRRATSDPSRRTSESSMVLPFNTVTRSNSLQDQFGMPSTANEGGAMQVSERGQQIPITNLNRVSQAGSVLEGPSLKRGSPESSQATLQSQQRRRRMPSSGLSISTPAQSVLPIQNLPEVASSTGLVRAAPSLPHQANSISLQPQLQTGPMPHYIPLPQSGAPMLPPQIQFLPFPPQRSIAPAFPPQLWHAQPFPLQARHFPDVPFHPGPAIPRPQQAQNAPTFPLQPGNAPTFPLRPWSTPSPQPRNHPHPPPQSQTARQRPPRPRATTQHQRHPRANQVFEIKWEDPDMKRRPLGHKCLICKRDLSFTEEGPAYMPIRPPPVAVLHCGHTFHELCLQRITPEAEATDPPCIPCATGES